MSEVSSDSRQWSVKYRPSILDEYCGQEAAKAKARSIIKNPNVGSILIYGPSGNGKTTLARIIANGVNGFEVGADLDYKEVNGPADCNKDQARDLVSTSRLRPMSKKRFIVIDEAHGVLQGAASVLLKPIEEPSKDTIWILCTDQPDKLLPTIRNRCFKIGLVSPSLEDNVDILTRICKKEKILIPTVRYKSILEKIATAANCVPREATQILQEFSTAIPKDKDPKKIEKILLQTLSQSPDIELNRVATKILIGIYSNKPDMVISAVNDTMDFVGLSSRLLFLNTFVLETIAGINPKWMNKEREVLKSKTSQVNISDASKVHKSLVEVRQVLGQFFVEGKDLMLANLVGLKIR